MFVFLSMLTVTMVYGQGMSADPATTSEVQQTAGEQESWWCC